ncbi:hypothetical protein, conserved [Trypanosoma brucei gambiense DAL972]|uniref:Uncharacterized protein n=1 Tax=Trypanosoma brucei gambiense (strain MHOM/CI/86/DAL972) TaxID=679716 RepID=D0A2K4_TRYB9|nr:hypothetical protein, conserved [Trypanosoma brucei gambiense DAL972]CBH15498.1 hypothetical protein, conserved [Trypanosoma brucei gambiense DAL972]|eukprot:XP_011777762.1 hypothetical protein, conserved [Trypanosoma brucei gambiense DAL972]
MSHDGDDGSLQDVNPYLLELCKDPVAWREQRRRALREKVFGRGTGEDSDIAGSRVGNIDRSTAVSALDPLPNTPGPNGPTRKSAEDQEAYVLQQIMSHKRKREEATAIFGNTVAVEAPTVKNSVKEKLLLKLQKGK